MAGYKYTPGSPILEINRGWRAIAAVAVMLAISSKVYKEYSRYDYDFDEVSPPGAYTGESHAERKSKYEGAGSSYVVRHTVVKQPMVDVYVNRRVDGVVIA